jgi:hypothetical protein
VNSVTDIIVNKTRQVIIDYEETLKKMATTTPKLGALLGELKVSHKLRAKFDNHRKLYEKWETVSNGGQGTPELMLSREESALFEELLGKAKLEKFQPH